MVEDGSPGRGPELQCAQLAKGWTHKPSSDDQHENQSLCPFGPILKKTESEVI